MRASVIRSLVAVTLAIMGVGALLHGMGTVAAQDVNRTYLPVTRRR
jgi:hypothetical protein